MQLKSECQSEKDPLKNVTVSEAHARHEDKPKQKPKPKPTTDK